MHCWVYRVTPPPLWGLVGVLFLTLSFSFSLSLFIFHPRFRQVLNTFVTYENPQYRVNVLKRAHQLIELENKMNEAFSMTPHFRPPVPELLRHSLTTTKKKKKVVVAKVKGKKAAALKKGKGKGKGAKKKNVKKKTIKKKKITAKAQIAKIASTAKERDDEDSSDDSSEDDEDSSDTDSEQEEEEDEEEDEDEDEDDTTTKKKKSSSASSSSASTSGPSSRMLDRLSKEAKAVFTKVVQSTYRQLSPDVCTILTFDIGAKDINTLLQTVPDSTVRHETSNPLKYFLIEHLYQVLKRSLPKRMTTSPFGRRKNTSKANNNISILTPVQTMKMYLKEVYVKKEDEDDEDEEQEEQQEDEESNTVCLGSTIGALAAIFGTLKNELRVEDPCEELFPMLRLIVQSIQVVVDCAELRSTGVNARVLLRTLHALVKGMQVGKAKGGNSSQTSSQSSQSNDSDGENEEEDNGLLGEGEGEGEGEGIQKTSPWLMIVKKCCTLSTNIGRYISSLVELEKDVMPFLSCIAALANLQNHATQQCLTEEVEREEDDVDFFDEQNKKRTHYTASTTLCELCYDIMSEGWGDIDDETGLAGENIKNSVLSSIINYYLHHSEHCLDEQGAIVNSRMKVTERLVETHLQELIQQEGCVGPVQHLLTLHKKTLPCYFSTLLINLVDLTRALKFNKNEPGAMETCIYNLQKIANWLTLMVNMTKTTEMFQKTYYLSATLKNVRAIIDILNKHIDTFFRKMMSKTNNTRQRILGIMKKLQKTTRQVQNICTHGKNITKNMALTSLIPHVKRALETFVFKIQALFVSIGSSGALVLGNLKHKGLDGKEVAMSDSGDEEGSEEEGEEDEEEDDEEDEEEEDEEK